MYNMNQPKKEELSKTKETSRIECAEKCKQSAECVGFDFDTKSKDCSLSKTPWKTATGYPAGKSYMWVCEKKNGKAFTDLPGKMPSFLKISSASNFHPS